MADRKLIIHRFHQAEFQRAIYQANIEEGITFEDVKKPEFWAHIASRLRPYDRIEVLADTGEYFAELLVLECDRLWAKVAVLRFVELAPAAPLTDAAIVNMDAYRVEYKGPQLLHVVIRNSDSEIVQDKLRTKVDAQTWIREHLKAFAK